MSGVVEVRQMDDRTREESLAAYYGDARHLRERQAGAGGQSVGGEFADWVLDLVDPPEFSSVLDAGAGVGRFTTRLAERARPGAVITAVDLFPSMIEVLRSLRHRADVEVRVVEADISDLPFDPAVFDLVMANHVLYHVRDLSSALSSLAKLLMPGGVFVATTNAGNARVPVLELHREVCRRLGIEAAPDASPFSSEDAGPILRQHFTTVVEREFTKPSAATSPAALVQSYRSTGRYQLLCQQRSEARVGDVAADVLAAWQDQPEKLVGEVRMSAFLCRGPLTPR